VASTISAFVLAGGKSTRMGTDKALILFDGQTFLERAMVVARSVSPEVSIVGDPEKYGRFAPCIPDLYPNCGPLGGIHAALHSSGAELNLMVAVDLPFITAGLLQFLLARAGQSETAIVTIPRAARGLQPLCAVYRRDFVVPAEQALRSGHYKIGDLFSPQNAEVIEEDALLAAGFSAKMFQNLNTPEDLTEATKKAER